jgi:hypothetical protein
MAQINRWAFVSYQQNESPISRAANSRAPLEIITA